MALYYTETGCSLASNIAIFSVQCCNIDVQVARRSLQSFDKLSVELYPIFKVPQNLFHKAAIYVHLTNLRATTEHKCDCKHSYDSY